MRFGILKLGILVLLLIPLFFLNIRDSHDWGDDFAQYILQARNLAEGKPQNEGAYIYNPDFPFYAPSIYPVGYPVLLAPVYAAFGNNILAFNYFQTLLLFFFGIALFFFLRKIAGDISALLLTLIAVYNPWMLEFKTQIIADIPFSLFMLLSAFSYLNFKEKLNWSSAVLTGCFTAFAILIKPSAAVLLVGFFADGLITHFIKRDFERNVLKKYCMLLLTPVVLYFFITHICIPSSVETTGHFRELYNTTEKWNKRFNINAGYYMTQFQDLFRFTNPDWDFFVVVMKAFALVLFLLGFFGKIFSRWGFLEIVTLVFLLLVLFFPNTTQGFRYLLPVLPFILLYIWYGFESIRLGKLNRKAVFVIACGFCLFQYKTTIEKMWREKRYTVSGPQQESAQEAFSYIVKNTEKDAVIAFIKPRALALYTGRKTLTDHPALDVNTTAQFFEKHGVRYFLLVKDISNVGLEKYVTAQHDLLDEVWNNGQFILYKRKG